MNTVNFTLAGEFKDPTVLIDGEPVVLTKQKDGAKTCVYQTENSEVEIAVTKVFEVNCKGWFWWGLLFFLISLFGIFNPRYDRHCRAVTYKCKFTLNESTFIRLDFNRFKEGQPALTCSCDCKEEESENNYFVDNTAKKRAKKLLLAAVLIWLALIIAVALIVVFVVL